MGDIVYLNMVTSLDSDPDRVLQSAMGNVERVLVIGWDKGGGLYTASSIADGGEVLWLMEKTKQRLMDYVDE